MVHEFVPVSVVSVYGLLLLWRSLSPRVGFASWHMFAHVSTSSFDLVDAEGRAFNPWQYMPHTLLFMNRATCERFLVFLRERHGLHLDGSVTVNTDGHAETLIIRGGYVVG